MTCGYVTVHGKGELADGIKDLEVGRLLWTVDKACGSPRVRPEAFKLFSVLTW